MLHVRSTPNIALIKYWGNRNDKLRLPSADSISMTLDSPIVEISADIAEKLYVRSFNTDGAEKQLTTKNVERFEQHFALCSKYIDSIPKGIRLEIRSQIPSGIGIASSAAVFSAVAKAYARLCKENLSDEQISILARLGSSSAARSVMGGFVALENTESNELDGAKARQIADENHWNLHDIIIVHSHQEKKVGSTEGHALAHTSPYFENRVKAIPRRMRDCTDAILHKDFEKLQAVSEEDCWDMHKVMETSQPSLRYLTDETHRITKEVEEFRIREHLEVLYTMDAGPTVHLICTEAALPKIKDYSSAQKGCTVYETKIDGGAVRLLSP